MLDTITHRWLRIPYTLKVRYVRRARKSRTTLLFIHGLGNTGDAWDNIIAKMPADVSIIAIDLLGFGDSPSPTWALYDAKTQARAVYATLLRSRVTTPVIIIGHSLGSLVAIEMAKRYPKRIERLILCSPPLYDSKRQRLPRSDDLLKQLYRAAEQNPQRFLHIAAFAMKYKLINRTFNVTDSNIDSYMATLSAMIINQTSLQDAHELQLPTTIIRGTFDPFVVTKNLTKLATDKPNITVKAIVAGHEVKGLFVRPVVKTILDQIQK